MTRRSVTIGLLLAALIVFAVGGVLVRASSAPNMLDTYVLQSGERLRGDLTVAARDVELQAGSSVDGDLSIVALGLVRLGGHISGDLSVLAPGSSVEVGPEFSVGGDVHVCARDLPEREALAVNGQVESGCDQLGQLLDGSAMGAMLPPIALPLLRPFDGNLSSIGGYLIQVGIASLVIAACAMLVSLLFPEPLRRVTVAAVLRVRTAGITGFLTLSMAFGLTLLLTILFLLTVSAPIFALPVITIGWGIISAALVLGWITIGNIVGGYVLRSSRPYGGSPIMAAPVGGLILTLIYGTVAIVPCVGWVSGLMLVGLGSIGFGGVILTRLGSRPYPEFVHRRPN